MNRLILNLNINLCWSIGEMGDETTFTLPFADKAKELLDSPKPQVLIDELLASHPSILFPTINNCGGIIFWGRVDWYDKTLTKESSVPKLSFFSDESIAQACKKFFEELLIETRAVRDLYYTCMQARSTVEKNSDPLMKCKLLHSAYDCTRMIHLITKDRISTVPDFFMDEAKFIVDKNYSTLLDMPAMNDFQNFLNIYEDEFRNKYGFQIRKTRPHKDARIKKPSMPLEQASKVALNYWDNKDATEAVKLALDVFGYKLGQEHRYEKDYVNYFTEWQTAEDLAEIYLSLLDNFISTRLDNIDFHFDSVNRELICSVPSLESALYLRIISDIVSTRDYKECIMCGCLFEPSRNDRKYCFRHTDSQINYYRTLKRKLNKSSTTKEDSEI